MVEESKKTEKKVVKTKTYTIKMEFFDDGTSEMVRQNDGFDALELIGLAEFISLKIREQILGRLNHTTIRREVVVS